MPSHVPLDRLIAVATDAARQAGAVLAECTRDGFRIEHKQVINLVTDADHQAEQRIIDVIHDAFPTHRVLAEERGLTEQPPSRGDARPSRLCVGLVKSSRAPLLPIAPCGVGFTIRYQLQFVGYCESY